MNRFRVYVPTVVVFFASLTGSAFAQVGAKEYDPTTGKGASLIDDTFQFAARIVGKADLVTGRFNTVFASSATGKVGGKRSCSVLGAIPISPGYNARRGRLREEVRLFVIAGGPDSNEYQIKRFDVSFVATQEGTRGTFRTTELYSLTDKATANFNVACSVLFDARLPFALMEDETFEYFFSNVIL